MKSSNRVIRAVSLALILIAVLAVAVGFPGLARSAHTTPVVNGLFWGDEDYTVYNLYSESVPGGRGFSYQFSDVPNDILYILVRNTQVVNDNVFANGGPGSDELDYTSSVGWGGGGHTFTALVQSDHLELTLYCGDYSWNWRQDLIHDTNDALARTDPARFTSDTAGTDGQAPVSSGSPPTDIVILESHSSLEWNVENSSLGSLTGTLDDWMSPDFNSDWEVLTDTLVTDDSGHEEYPFFMGSQSHGGLAPDGGGDYAGWEWEVMYESKVDVSACNGTGGITFEANSAHNSPAKDDIEDNPIPTAIRLENLIAESPGGLHPVVWILLFALMAGIALSLIRRGVREDTP